MDDVEEEREEEMEEEREEEVEEGQDDEDEEDKEDEEDEDDEEEGEEEEEEKNEEEEGEDVGGETVTGGRGHREAPFSLGKSVGTLQLAFRRGGARRVLKAAATRSDSESTWQLTRASNSRTTLAARDASCSALRIPTMSMLSIQRRR